MSRRTPPDTAIYAVGDIHGRLDLLLQLQMKIAEDAVQRTATRKLLVYLGDYVSRGADSRAVVDRVREWQPVGIEPVWLKGNHEDLLLRFLGGELDAGRHWFDYDGLDTLASYGVEIPDREVRDEASVAALRERFVEALPAAHLDFFRSLRVSFRAGDYFFVHGGVRPGTPLAHQSDHDCMWIRKSFLDSDLEHGAMIVHGHSISPQPVLRHNRIGIDTGAYRSGVLTCLVLDDEVCSLLQTANP